MIPFYRNTVLPKVEMELPIFRCGDYVVEYFYGQRQYLVFTRSRTNKYLSRIFSRRYVSRNLYCNPYRSSGSSRYRHLGDIIENIGHEVAVFCFMRRSSGTSQYFVLNFELVGECVSDKVRFDISRRNDGRYTF